MGKAKRLKQQRRKVPPPVSKRGGRNQQGLPMLWIAVAAVVIVAVVLGVVLSRSHSSTRRTVARPITAGLAGVQTTKAPWAPEYGHLSDRLAPLGLDALTQEGAAEHIHSHLDVFVLGKHLVVPARIGINDNAYITEVHTHDTSGVIHVESPSRQTFVLGQFFGAWGVRLTSECLGGYCGAKRNRLQVFVNGKPTSTPPWQIPLRAHEEIAVVFGKLASAIPSVYNFPAGE